MNTKGNAYEFVNLIKFFRNGQQESHSMPRWIAELEMGCISVEQPDVERAQIEPIHLDRQATYPVKRVDPQRALRIALCLAEYLTAPLVA